MEGWRPPDIVPPWSASTFDLRPHSSWTAPGNGEHVRLLGPGHICPMWASSNGVSLLRAPHWVGPAYGQFCIAVGGYFLPILLSFCFSFQVLLAQFCPFPLLNGHCCTRCIPNASQCLLPRRPKYLHVKGAINGGHSCNSSHNCYYYYFSN